MKSVLLSLIVALFNRLANLLRNRKWQQLNREEIRCFRISFSQFGEDLAVNRWAEELGIETGHYLDIGAFHPILLSNTLLLHQRGWSGTNIDMNPDKIELFNHYRPHDDNICCAISASGTRFAIDYKGLPTERLRELSPDEDAGDLEIIQSRTIADTLKFTDTSRQKIDYLNIDCEGFDYEVLSNIDLEKLSVSIITIEALNQSAQDTICHHLAQHGYRLREKIHWTLLFTRDDAAAHLPHLGN